jgi:hypothetical protein
MYENLYWKFQLSLKNVWFRWKMYDSLKNIWFADFRRFRQSLIYSLIPDWSMYSHILIFRVKSFSSSIHKWRLFELKINMMILKKILSSFIVEEKNSNIQKLILICFEFRTLFDLKNNKTSTIKRCFRYLNKTMKIKFELRMLLHLCLREE